MGAVIAITSGKGGTGKTFLTAAVASCLAALDQRVLCIDADVGLRNLDIALGVSDRVMMDFSDVAAGRSTLEDAAVAHPEILSLHLLAAPMGLWQVDQDLGLGDIVPQVKEAYDICLIDCPAGLGAGFGEAVKCADRAIVVTTTDLTSLRDAQQAVGAIHNLGVSQCHLAVNRVRPKHLRSLQRDLDDVMDTVGLPLLGVVPEDERVILSANREIPLVLASRGGAAMACMNIARRIKGERVPLMRIR